MPKDRIESRDFVGAIRDFNELDNQTIYSYICRVNRRKDELIQIEIDLLDAAMVLRRHGLREFHGFLMGKALEEAGRARSVIGHGTLYKALYRLEERGYLESRWEDTSSAGRTRGPRRRLYEVTAAGQRALAAAPGRARLDRLERRPTTS